MSLTDSVAHVIELAGRLRQSLPPGYQGDDTAFATADPWAVFSALRSDAGQGLRFLEWGSGIGTITTMAACLGYRSFGIEADSALVTLARKIAAQAGVKATFAVGNCLPVAVRAEWAAELNRRPPVESDPDEQSLRLRLDGDDGYAGIGRSLDWFDVVFAFPWPEEIDACHEVFARHAAVGARLLIFSQTAGVLSCLRQPSSCGRLVPS